MSVMDGIRINTSSIGETAATIESLNRALAETLENSQADVRSLQGVWTGAAADAAVQAYNSFASKYFEEYQQMLQDYVNYLRSPAVEGWTAAEKENTEIGQNIVDEMI